MYQGRFSGSDGDHQNQEYPENYLNDPYDPAADLSFSEQPDEAAENPYGYMDPASRMPYGNPLDDGNPGYTDPGYPSQDYGDMPYQGYDPSAYAPQSYGSCPEQTYGDVSYDEQEESPQPVKRFRKGPIIVGIVFYLLLAGCIGLFYMMNQKNLDKVEKELLVYEQAQPVYISEQVFKQLFSHPDWKALYAQAGIQDTAYENSDAFAEYMQQRVGDQQITYRQLTYDQAAPLVYGVYAGEDQIGSFSLSNQGTSPQAPEWILNEINLLYAMDQHYRIQMEDGQKVMVNGVPLDDSLVVQEEFLQTKDEQKTRLPGKKILEVRGLMVQPTVTAEGADGKALVVSFDEATGTFTVPAGEVGKISDEQKQLALDTVHTYCKYMINKAGGPAGLAKYFKQETPTFKAIVGSDLAWVQKESGHNFANEEVSDFISYGDNKFSVHVDLTWQLTRPDDSVKESQVEKTLVFEKSEDKWLCTRMTGFDLADQVKNVRLTFWNQDQVLESSLIDSEADAVSCPEVAIPEGKKLAGWAILKTDENGAPYYQRILEPDTEGNAKVASSLVLEPMDLHPIFENQ